MSTQYCDHGNVVSDQVGEYRCFECEPFGPDDFNGRMNLLRNLTPCDDCGVVFKDRDAYGEHQCAGKQGR